MSLGPARQPVRRSIPILLFALLPVLAVVRPPETVPWSRAACHVVALLALFVVLLRDEDLSSFIPRWLGGLLPFVAVSVLIAACRSRAIDELADALLLVLTGLLGWSLARRAAGARVLALVITTLGAGVALDAVVQHHIIYPSAAAALRAAPGSGSAAVLGILEAGRPSGPFILPAALGGFLALSLPLTLVMAGSGTTGARRATALCALLVQVYALSLSRSIGAVVALAAALLVMLVIRKPKRRVTLGIVVLLLAALGTGYFLLSRRLEIEAASGNDPLSLRLGNWGAACMMIGEHPLFGVGPGSFATAYPRFVRSGMNETRYAHNSYLQAAATWGLWIAAPVGALLLAFARRARVAAAGDPIAAGVLAAGASFLVHNLGDFTAWLPSLAIPAAMLLGLATAPDPAEPNPGRPRGWRRAVLILSLLAIAALDVTHEVRRARMRGALAAAAEAAQHENLDQALRQARRAAALRPDDPEPHAFLAQLILDRLSKQADLAREGERASDRALALDPEAAILHYTRALYHQAAGEIAAAYRERYAAHLLYPQKPLYQEPARRSTTP